MNRAKTIQTLVDDFSRMYPGFTQETHAELRQRLEWLDDDSLSLLVTQIDSEDEE